MIPAVKCKYLACDPGETNGIALYDENGVLLWFGQIPLENLAVEVWKLVTRYRDYMTFIIESYRVYPQMAKEHVYDELKTAQAIGRLKAIAEIMSFRVVEQPAANTKKMGFKYMGNPKVKHKERHQWDAHAHGMYFLVNNGIIDFSEPSSSTS